LYQTTAPTEVKAELTKYEKAYGAKFRFNDQLRESWLVELICDLFGLVLFGPAFLGAHRALLQAIRPNPLEMRFNLPTHPPYAIRHKMLSSALSILRWNKPITNASHNEIYAAENAFIKYISADIFPQWTAVFDNSQLNGAIAGLKRVFSPYKGLDYESGAAETLVELVDRLRRGLPPIVEQFDTTGKPTFERIGVSQVLYAGWVYWLGRASLTNCAPLEFIDTNRLCDHAIMQQRAINDAIDAGIV
jgi:hypothetical protein